MKNDGGPAFPYVVQKESDDVYRGMSLRQYYAGQAMMGMRAAETDCSMPRWDSQELARRAVKDADALLAELAKEE